MSYKYRFDKSEYRYLSFNTIDSSLCVNMKIRFKLSSSRSKLKLIGYDSNPSISNCVKSIFAAFYITSHEYLDAIMTDVYLLGGDIEVGTEVHSEETMSSIIKHFKKKLMHEEI